MRLPLRGALVGLGLAALTGRDLLAGAAIGAAAGAAIENPRMAARIIEAVQERAE